MVIVISSFVQRSVQDLCSAMCLPSSLQSQSCWIQRVRTPTVSSATIVRIETNAIAWRFRTIPAWKCSRQNLIFWTNSRHSKCPNDTLSVWEIWSAPRLCLKTVLSNQLSSERRRVRLYVIHTSFTSYLHVSSCLLPLACFPLCAEQTCSLSQP